MAGEHACPESAVFVTEPQQRSCAQITYLEKRTMRLHPHLSVVCALGLQACVVQLGTGDGETGGGGERSVSGSGGTGGSSASAGSSVTSTTPDDLFAGADPIEVQAHSLRASATAYLVQGAVEQAAELQGLDPETIDPATMQQMIDAVFPDAAEQADAWVSTLDPTLFDAQVYPAPAECYDMGCPATVLCDSVHYKKKILCGLRACGDGKCSTCPDWFGPLKNLFIRAWCSYVCMDGATVVGSAGLVITRPFDTQIQFCLVP